MREQTVRLFDKEPYGTSFGATVVSCEEVEQKGKKGYQVILDQTLFFPEEGGQSPDKGTIDGVEVWDVQIKNGIISHTLAEPLQPGSNVRGCIDWQHRFYNMQQHSGEHIFSGIVHSRFGYNNVGFHLSDRDVTMDFDGVLTAEDIEDVEWKVNEVIAKNIPIEVTYPSKQELVLMDYRSKIEIEGQVRIVTIPGIDVCACCAPHVKQTGEIGILKVVSSQNYKGGVRISIRCGFRALMEFRQKAAIVGELTGLLTTGQDKLVENVAKLKANYQQATAKLAEANQKRLLAEVEKIPGEQEHVFLFEEDLDRNVARNAVNQMVEAHGGICGIFIGDDRGGYSFILDSKNVNCKEIVDKWKEELSVQGGGSPKMVQGSVTATEQEIRKRLP